jgi:hypothetical protein
MVQFDGKPERGFDVYDLLTVKAYYYVLGGYPVRSVDPKNGVSLFLIKSVIKSKLGV